MCIRDRGYAYRNKTNAEWEYDTSTPGLPSGTYTVVNIPVEITQQPKDTDITYGEDATVSIEAEAFDTDKTISYQWYLDTGLSVKPVATGASLKLSGLDAGEYGDYYCEVTCDGYTPVSYTHLDVYKRQILYSILHLTGIGSFFLLCRPERLSARLILMMQKRT